MDRQLSGRLNLTEMTENNGRERIAEDEFQNTGQNQEQSAEQNQHATMSNQLKLSELVSPGLLTYLKAAPPPPAPLHAIKQQASGVAVNTKAPRPLGV